MWLKKKASYFWKGINFLKLTKYFPISIFIFIMFSISTVKHVWDNQFTVPWIHMKPDHIDIGIWIKVIQYKELHFWTFHTKKMSVLLQLKHLRIRKYLFHLIVVHLIGHILALYIFSLQYEVNISNFILWHNVRRENRRFITVPFIIPTIEEKRLYLKI